jgi:DNA-binding GntR family transcriptional regulator
MQRYGRVASGAAPRLYQQAFAILARHIEQGGIPSGSRLLESRVAAQFRISRTPARQALAELARCGLVEKATGRGYMVRATTWCSRAAPASAVAARHDVRLIPSSSWERIYGEVESEIMARASFASWRVNEAELARHYRVSRTVARDVIARLQQRGVVRKDERARWQAPALTPEHVGELYELRAILEPVALVKAAPNAPPGFVAGMRAHLEDAIAHAREIDGSTLDELEQEMHVLLLGRCGNRALMQTITLAQSLLIAHRFLYRWTPRLFESEPFLPEHLAIVERLQSGRTAEAARSLKRHLRVSRERAIARIAVVAREFDPDDLGYLERADGA